MNLVNELLTTFCHASEFATVALSHILAARAQPQSFVFEVLDLLGIQVSSVKVMLSPVIEIAFLGASEIAET